MEWALVVAKQAQLDAARAAVSRCEAELTSAKLRSGVPFRWGVDVDAGLMRYLARALASVNPVAVSLVCSNWRENTPVRMRFVDVTELARNDLVRSETRVWCQTDNRALSVSDASHVAISAFDDTIAWIDDGVVRWKRLSISASPPFDVCAPCGAPFGSWGVKTSNRLGIAVISTFAKTNDDAAGPPLTFSYWLVDARVGRTVPLPTVTRLMALVSDWIVFHRDKADVNYDRTLYAINPNSPNSPNSPNRMPGDEPLVFRLSSGVDYVVPVGDAPARIKVCTQTSVVEIDLDAATLVREIPFSPERIRLAAAQFVRSCVARRSDMHAYVVSERDLPDVIVVVRDGVTVVSTSLQTEKPYPVVYGKMAFSANERALHVTLRRNFAKPLALMTIDLSPD